MNTYQSYTRWYLLTLYLVYMLMALTTKAQEVNHLEIERSKLRGRIDAIEKDSLGYIWIGTSQGLNRYSGYEMKNYAIDEDGKRIINGVSDIIKHEERLLILDKDGKLLSYQYVNDSFDELFSWEESKSTCLASLSDKEVIIGLHRGFLIYDLIKGQSSELLFPELSFVRLIQVFGQQVFVATSNGIVVFEYANNGNKLVKKKQLLEGVDVLHFAFDQGGRMWVGTEKSGLLVLDGEQIERLQLIENEQGRPAIRNIEFDQKNRALISVDRLGLFVLDAEFEIRHVFRHNPDDPNSIRQNSIYEMYVDENNVYWLGSREAGIDLIYPDANLFTNVFHVINEENSIHDNNIRSILKDQNGNIWFGTENGMSQLDPQNNWKNYYSSPKLKNTAILTIDDFQDGKLLLGSYGKGMLIFDPQKARATDVYFDKKEKPFRFVFATLVEEEGREIWVGGNDKDLHHYREGELINRYSINLVKCIAKGKSDLYYVGSDFGLFEINTRNQSVRKVNSPDFENFDQIYALYFDTSKDVLWIGNNSGLFSYAIQTKKITHIEEVSGEELGAVYSILQDAMGNLWLGTISGLWRYSIVDDFFRRYDEKDGVLIDELGIGASATFEDGTLAFGGPSGAVFFNPSSLTKDVESSQIFVSDFQVNGVTADSSILDQDINFTNELLLDFDQNSLSFTFEVLSYYGAKKNTFVWQLHGYDDTPVIAKQNRKAIYSNLEPGTYYLETKTINADGVEGVHTYQLKIKINNPFWKTWPAFIVYACLFGLIVYLLILANNARFKQKLGEEKIKFFVDVAHDIRTPVSLIQLLVEQLSGKKSIDNSIDLILRNTRNLNEYVNQLIDFQKASQNQLQLTIEEIDLTKMIDRILADLHPLLVDKSMDVNTQISSGSLWVDKRKFRRIFYNMISNAIKYTEEGGQIKIITQNEADAIHVDIIDNGIGIPENQQKDIFSRFTRGTNVSNTGIPGNGIGLMLSKKIVELHGGQILLESKENVGTKFTIILKRGTAHYEGHEILVEDKKAEQAELLSNFVSKDKLILLVEDNNDLRQTIRKDLAQSYRVIDSTNGKEALMIALDKRPDLIITDVVMPEMDGKELCKVIKANFATSHIPVVMITALQGVDDKIESLEFGADAYVEKPFSMRVLKATINNLLKARQTIQQITADTDSKESISKSPDDTFLSEAVQLIKNNLENETFTIDELCKELGMSRSNFFRKLKGLTGMTPSNLIMEIKLQHAIELLKANKDMNIAEVAWKSGFQDPKYFSTVFKKHIGQTPKAYAESL